MNATQSQVGLVFWLKWVLATSVGMLVGFFLGFMSTALIPETFTEAIGVWTDFLVLAIVLGIVVGLLQWIVLRRYVAKTGWWILTNTAVACGIFLSGFDPLESFGLLMRWTGIVALGCAVTSILQWLVLRRQVTRAGWWVLFSTVGLLLCIIMTRFIQLGEGRDRDVLMGSGLAGILGGLITGGVLVWLLRQSAPEN